MSHESSTLIKTDILQLIQDNDDEAIAKLIETLSTKEIVYLIGHLSRNEQMDLFTHLSPEDAAELIEEVHETQAIRIIEDMEPEDAAAIINEMESDDQADIIMELGREDATAILEQMDVEEANMIRKLLNYDPDCAGGLMHTEYFVFRSHQTIAYVTNNLRTNAEKYKDYPLKYIFVTTTDNTLKGVLQMQDLLLAPIESTLATIKNKEVVFVNHLTPLDELIDFFQAHDLIGVPVVDDEQQLLGVVLRKDILEAENERLTQEHLETQGIIGGDELRTMPVMLRAKRRLSWLSVNILLNIIAASVIAYNQEVLSSVIALAVFLPIISDMSGCSGNQAVAVSMRELSIGVVAPNEVLRVWWQEITVGVINGLALGTLIGLAAFFGKANVYFSVVVGSALALNTMIAVSIGGTVPLLLKKFDVDPALASGPILTTITDMVGFLLTLTFAGFALAHLEGL